MLNLRDSHIPSAFLLLPREIRDQIYDELLGLEVSRPEFLQGQDGRREERHRCGPIYHENQPPQISSLGALSCSHQVSEETQDAIKRKYERNEAGTKWKLDLMISDKCLKPTWLALPVPPKFVKSLDLEVRVFEPKDWDCRSCVEGRYLLHVLRSFFNTARALQAVR